MSASDFPKESNAPEEYLRQYFNFAYFFYLSPYKFVKHDSETFHVESDAKHKVICCMTHTLAIYRNMFFLVQFYPYDGNFTNYFGVVVTICLTCLYKATFLISLWRFKVFLDLLNEVQINHHQQHMAWQQRKNNKSTSIWLASFLLCSFHIVLVIGCTVLGQSFTHYSEASIETLVHRFSEFTQSMFTFRSAGNEPIPPARSLDYLLALVQVVIEFYKQMVSYYSNFSIFMCALTFQALAKDFLVSVKFELGDTFSHHRVLYRYAELRRIIDNINAAIGPTLFGCLLEEFSNYAMNYVELVLNKNYFVVLRYSMFLLGLFASLFISARATRQLQVIEDWLLEERGGSGFQRQNNLITDYKMVMMVGQLNKQRIGISPMGLFTVTYAFIGTAISLVLSYAVVVVQLRGQ